MNEHGSEKREQHSTFKNSSDIVLSPAALSPEKRCKICRYPKLRRIVNKLYESGYTYREIIQFLKQYGIRISLGTLSNHFLHERLQLLERIPDIRDNEVILSPSLTDEIITDTVIHYFMPLTVNEIEEILSKLNTIRKKITEYPLTTNVTLYLELKEILAKIYPTALRDFKTFYIDTLTKHGITTEAISDEQ